MRRRGIAVATRAGLLGLMALSLACAGARVVNVPLERYSPTLEGRPEEKPRDSGEASASSGFCQRNPSSEER